MAVRVSEEWFGTCGGCEVSILDVGDALLDLLPALDFVHMPVLMDHKYFGQTGERRDGGWLPEADVGIVTGCIRNEENRALAIEMRSKVKTLISLGSCASFGGIPALGNLSTLSELLDTVYRGLDSTDPADPPSRDIPPLLERTYAVTEIVDADVVIPGCPPEPTMIARALNSLLEGTPFTLPEKSVCDECPAQREKKALTVPRRPLEPVERRPPNEMRCLMEQGFLCLGPATRAGCGGELGAARCVMSHMPCRGCFGPLKETSNQMVDMMSALSSVGLDVKAIADRAATFNRYAGAQGRLRPAPARR